MTQQDIYVTKINKYNCNIMLIEVLEEIPEEIIPLKNYLSNIEGQILYAKWETNSLNVVQVNENQIMVRCFSIAKSKTIKAKLGSIKFEGKKILSAFFVDSEAFILTSNPLQLFFFHQLSENLIQLSLEEEINVDEVSAYVEYPYIYFYCRKQNQNRCTIHALHLTTLAIKTVCPGKGYTPENYAKFGTIYGDKRLYVFGGQDRFGKKCEELLWTFDFQKQYWFALQMKMDKDMDLSLVEGFYLRDGKSLIRKQERFWLIQLYQSKIREIEGMNLDKGQYMIMGEWLILFGKEGVMKIWKFQLKGKRLN